MDRVKGLQWQADLRYTATKYIPLVSYKKLNFLGVGHRPTFFISCAWVTGDKIGK
jgi:hypothetical protein|tara:strand:+ start:658 stop:822 length:165 start_codon:yes stop_codon:yes gene_type:complete